MTTHGLVLLQEAKDKGCHHAYTLYERLARLPHVESAYPLIGGIDGAVWLAAPDLDALTTTLRAVQATDGVRWTELLLAAPDHAVLTA